MGILMIIIGMSILGLSVYELIHIFLEIRNEIINGE